MSWRQPLAILVKGHADEQARVLCTRCRGSVNPVLGKHPLNLIPQLLFDYCWMLARIGVPFVRDLTAIDTVLQHQIEGPAGELLTAKGSAVCQHPPLAPNSRASSSACSTRTDLS